MKRSLIIVLALGVIGAGLYLTASKWAIRHQTYDFYDVARERPVDVDVAVRWDVEMQANAGMLTLPVAVINHGNTVKFTEYSFLANLLAARGYMAVSIQHDLASDAPLMTIPGKPYVGREPVYERDVANILFAIDELKKIQPHADYDHLTLIGHSNGGDISMYFADTHPNMVKRVVTLDNLRVPLVRGAFKILSFRSTDPNFKPDPGVVPADVAGSHRITIVKTPFQHTDMSDRGPDKAKDRIESELSKFLNDDSELAPVKTDKIDVPPPPPPSAPVTAAPRP